MTATRPLLGTCRLQRPRTLGGDDDFGKVWNVVELDDQRLLVLDILAPPYFKIVSRSSGAVTDTFGPRGEGPQEFQHPVSVFQSEARPGMIEVYDAPNQRISFFDVRPDATWPLYRAERPVRTDGGLDELAPYKQGYVGTGVFAEHALLAIDSTGRPLKRLVTDPPFDPARGDVGVGAARFLNESRLAGHQGRVAIAYVMTSVLDLVDLETREYRRIIGPRPAHAEFEVRDGQFFMDRSSVGAYVDVAVAPRLIFGLFIGLTHEEQLAIMREDPSGGLSKFIHVFDWDGRYVAEFEMETGLARIDISSDHRWLWSDYEDPIPRVAEWSLPPIIDLLDRWEGGENISDSDLCPNGHFGRP